MKPSKAAKAKPKTKSGSHGRRHLHKSAKLNVDGLEADPDDGRDQAAALTHPGMPVYYPTYIVAPYVAGTQDWQPEYCFSSTGNCNSDIEPATAYASSYPRQYRIPIRGEHDFAAAYRMTVQMNGFTDQYYGIQGVAWRDPPLLASPSATKVVKGRKLYLYAAAGKLTTVAWHEGNDSYWISNDLTSDLPNHEMVALAASMVRYR
jgi:hypothetical protein